MTDLEHFIDSLELYKPIADFKVLELFKFSRFEDGLPKSIILQKERLLND